ncbi:class I SAM-dependent methyltransferase [bacterium]|nr:class I SAM-dependent methyltransferase [bacterium]
MTQKTNSECNISKSLEESVVLALDGSDTELFPFLPYILQDLWEFGADPEIIIDLVRKHADNYSDLKILDLGCGKAAVSIKLAKELNCKCFGIEAIDEFIQFANNKAKEYGVDHLCNFEVNDIRGIISEFSQFDVIILGAIGPVFGDYSSTLKILSKCLNRNGMIIIDDSYIEDDSDYTHPLIQKKESILQQINETGMLLVDEVTIPKEEIKSSDDYIFTHLRRRCIELIDKHPNKRQLFNNYIKKQEEENDILETKVVSSTFVIKKKQE